MSYINTVVRTGISNPVISNFLFMEGFTVGRNPFGHGECLRYVTKGDYIVWVCVHSDFIYLNAEYNCGGTVSEMEYRFEENDRVSFMKAYYSAVEWAKNNV